MKILAINGSPNVNSVNGTLLDVAAKQLGDAAVVDRVNLATLGAPLYSTDIEKATGAPEPIRALAARIEAADAVIIGSPEHNGLPTATLKNAIDWLSRVEPGKKWLEKPLVLLSTSPGAGGGATQLGTLAGLAPWWGADLVASVSIGSFFDAVDADERVLTKSEDVDRLSAALASLIERSNARLAS
ncbi:MAG: NAD(P)H-dependent oxidoreductase [Proteobacteria bacterium]|nr:NAD(P)H-dependent oxidoreductase [Pseudomonadota bacterium]